MFTSRFFFPFLILTAVIYWLLKGRKIRTGFLILSSYAFIGYFDVNALIVTIGLTLYTYFIAVLIEKSKNKKIIHHAGVWGLIIVLAAFKYLGFLAGTINNLVGFFKVLPVFRIETLLLPLGISYLVFKCISYLTDIYWGIVKKDTLLNFACYNSLFTIFVAGPIERFERLQPQLEINNRGFNSEDLSYAFKRIVFGLFKKLVLADWIGYFINPVWQNQNQYSSLIRIAALVGFSFQVYFDFAGYSDIAIGSSRLFGLRIMENFNNPYLAPNISQFWRRWHISLSDWIRDYIFFPLSQGKTSRFWLVICVPVIAMSICGLWHGAAWHFVIWGAWHGIGISILQHWNKIKRQYKLMRNLSKNRMFYYFSVIFTFVFVTAGWSWFR
jgi:D-alanyl-lipoteichoic acid acyltransferase DltB (MBOAT superfamily)